MTVVSNASSIDQIPEPYRTAHGLCHHHRARINKCAWVGCFYCLSIYRPDQIEGWVGRDGETALCPHCHVDAVLPVADGRPTTEFLRQMRHWWFQ